jgi:hypothetical protein
MENRKCPFCDGEGRECSTETEDNPLEHQYWVRCISCGAEGGWAKTQFGGWMNWNMRTQSVAQLEMKVKELEGVIRHLGWQ